MRTEHSRDTLLSSLSSRARHPPLLQIYKAREGNLRKFIACFVVATVFVAFAPALATAPLERVQVIIVFKERPNAALIMELSGEVITTYNIIPGLAARMPIGALEELAKNPAIAYIEPDVIVHALEQQVPWGISRIGAPSAWSSSTGGEVKVAILDTGIQGNHPDLATNVKGGISVVGETYSTNPADWNDWHGHGTHVAGTVAAVNNDVGVVGSAPAAWLYAVKVLSDSGEGPVSDVIEGIDWSVQNGMQVLNMSLGTAGYSSALEEACDRAYEAGLLLVAAAGNEGDGNPNTTELSYPAAFDSVIAVAATDSNDQAPSWSNSGPFVELAAPGVSIYSTYKGSTYTTKSGTSMAAPHVGGTAALVWACNPSLTNVQVRSILQQTAEDLGFAGRDTVYGYGLVRADEAVQVSSSASSSENLPYDHVILIVIDAVRPDVLVGANTPNFDNLTAEGSYTWNAWTVTPSVTIAAIPSIYTGATPEVHGVTDWDGEIYAETIVEVFEEAGLPSAIVGQDPILGGYSATYCTGYYYHPEADENFTSTAIEWFIEYRPFFLTIYNPMPDRRGHAYGHESDEYREAIENADYHVGRFVQTLRDQGVYDRTLIVITTDHGMTGTSHGYGYENDMRIFSIWRGPGVKENYQMVDNVYIPPSPTYDETYVAHRIIDIAPTIVSLMGLRAPENSEGTIIHQIFQNANPSSDPPIHIHLTWGENDTSHTIAVTWKTATAGAGDNVLYDIVPRGGVPGLYAYSATGSYHTYSGAGGYIHDVELTGLSPNTRYYFICGGYGGYSAERSFQTAPDQSTGLRFIAGGDSRSGAPDWPEGRNNVSRVMAKFNPSFVLYGGDFVYNWDNQSQWDNWFAGMQEYWIDNDGLTIPIITAIGNHEIYFPQPSNYDPATQATNYYGQFYLPGNERWYSLDWGPDLHIIVLDSEVLDTGSDTWSEQLAWLESDLAAHASATWKIVTFHRPAYASRGSLLGAQTDWVPLFDNYNVDLVISGHHHYYERTHPLENNQISENGTVYIVSAGWGAPLYYSSPQWFTAYGPTSIYHFVVIDIFGKTLHLRAINTDGGTFDEIYINKSPKFNVSISPSENSGLPSTTLNYTVTVTNTGKLTDNYNLTVSDNAVPSWAPSLSDNLENVQPSESKAVTLSVTIPGNATHRTEDNITVTATSAENADISENVSCIARAITFDVGVSISPTWQENFPGKTLAYVVTVTNTGVLVDNYTLTVSDNFDWALTLSENLLENIEPSEDRVVTLGVTIPEDAIGCTEDNIIVTVTSMADNAMRDNDSCIAHAVSPKAEFSFATLYAVRLNVDNWLENGSKLVVKFYTWGNNFQAENVVWSGTTPEHIVLLEDIPHPQGGAVEKARLDLTTDNTENVISTLSTFIVRKIDLEVRFGKIPGEWFLAPPGSPERTELEIEFSAIPGKWFLAPS